MSDPRVDLVFRDRRLVRDRALIMAVVDAAASSDAARHEAIRQAVGDGADLVDLVDLVDLGEPLDDDGLRRLVSLVEWTRATYPGLAISVRTDRRAVAEQARVAGADLFDDGWGTAEPGVLDVAVRSGAGYLCADEPGRADHVTARGVPREAVLVRVGADPAGLARLGELVDAGWQVLVDAADRSAPTTDRLAEALASTTLAAKAGAVVLRSRYVRATRHAAEMVSSILGTRPQSRPERWLA